MWLKNIFPLFFWLDLGLIAGHWALKAQYYSGS